MSTAPRLAEEKVFPVPAELYDRTIHWEKRLAREAPFFRWLFDRFGLRRILDVACGTGRHAALFHSWGLEVEGSDASAEMIAYATSQFGTPPGLRWRVRDFLQPPTEPESFDAAVCLGNSLSLLQEPAEIEKALRHMLAAVRPGGVLVIHLINYELIPDGRSTWQKVLPCLWQGRSLLAVKGIHRLGNQALVNLVLIDPEVPAIYQSYGDRLNCAVERIVWEVVDQNLVAGWEIYADYSPGSPAREEELRRAQDHLIVFQRK
jgi:SAM-dependent methyltransferase